MMLTMKGEVLLSSGDTTSPLASFLEANVCSLSVKPPPVGFCSPEVVASCISSVSNISHSLAGCPVQVRSAAYSH